jgi:hypothetical protein
VAVQVQLVAAQQVVQQVQAQDYLKAAAEVIRAVAEVQDQVVEAVKQVIF